MGVLSIFMSLNPTAWRSQIIKLLLILIALAIITFLLRVMTEFLVTYIHSLYPYLNDLNLALTATVVGIGGYFIISIMRKIISLYLLGRMEVGIAHTIGLFIDIGLYSILILAILATLKINLTSAAIGGAVGGIAIGLAAQTILSNILSGTLVTTSKTLKPGDEVSLITTITGNPIVGEIIKIGILYTDVKTINGNVVRIPNSAFLGSTIFTKLQGENSLIYPYQIILNADVSADKIMEKANNYMKDYFTKIKIPLPEVYFTGKNGGTNVFTIIIYFNEMKSLNKVLDTINKVFDKAYWDAKNEKT